jgi:hypothetical protein
MKLKWDFHELYEFNKRLSDSSYELETALMTITREIAKVLHSNLIRNTPIDTGNLRKMWSAGENLKFTVTPMVNGYEVVLINEAVNKQNVSNSKLRESGNGFMYGVAVNDGHKTPTGGWVMGKFFVEKSIVQTENSSQLQKIIYRELEKWFRWCVNGK